jgi:hypothetical protein
MSGEFLKPQDASVSTIFHTITDRGTQFWVLKFALYSLDLRNTNTRRKDSPMMYCKWPIVNLCRKNGDGNYEFNFNKISLDGHEMFGVSSI